MGAGASTQSAMSSRSKDSTSGCKPEDASDIKSLAQAREEIIRLRKIESSLKKEDSRNGNATGSAEQNTKNGTSMRNKKEGRAAVVAKAAEKDYVKKVVPKSDVVRKLIYNAIKPNTLFRACCEEELADLIDVFERKDFSPGSTVIQQGDEGEHFYVVETGSLDITVCMGDNNGATTATGSTSSTAAAASSGNEVHVGVPYESGSAFGELALMYGSPRAATIRAKDLCQLWSITRRAYRGITGQYKLKRAEMDLEFLRKVRIGDKVVGDVLKESDIYNMALASQRDSFRKGDVIVREGEKGDVFYLIVSGTVEVFKKETGEEVVTTLSSGHFFGEKALLSEDVRQATCIASSDVKCLFLMREDFVLMLGDLQDLLDGNSRNIEDSDEDVNHTTRNDDKVQYKLSDLEVKKTLGIGAFGRIKLVKAKSDSEPSGNGQTYALKCLAKRSIVENGLQDHVLNERNIMDELNHPFILKFHCAMQDDKYIYFLLEVLLGGELFKALRAETQFPESWSRFYAASVIQAFCQIHSRKIAYRDLKPENLVMDSDGYLKVVDFGLAKKLEGGKTWTLCGTPDYLAPEVILNEGHDWAVDYWALGVLIYEMTAGSPPFYADDPMEVYEKILSGHVSIPSHFSRGLADLVRKLLKTYQSKRLGRTRGGISTVMKHKWFSGFDWDALLEKKLKVPIQPKVENSEDASNFDEYPEEDPADVKDCPGWSPSI